MVVSPQDEDLVAAALRGDEDSFRALVERHFGLVFLVGFSHLGSREMAEDLAQEVFLRAHLFLGQLDPPKRFPAWVSRVARNLAIDWKRRGQTASRLLSMVPLEDAMEMVPDNRSADPRERSAGEQERQIIQRAIQDLPAAQREVILLHHCEELSQPEIARRLGVNQSSVSRQLKLARIALQRILDPVLHETITSLRPSRSAVARASMVAVASASLSATAKASLVAAAGGAAAGKATGSVKVAGATWSLSTLAFNLVAGVKAMGAAKGIAAGITAAVAIGGGIMLTHGNGSEAPGGAAAWPSDEPEGMPARLVELYSLAPGESFKFIPEPFIEERAAYCRSTDSVRAGVVPGEPGSMIFEDLGGSLELRSTHFSPASDGGITLGALLQRVFNMPPDMVEGDMTDRPIRGDFVTRGNLAWDSHHAEVERVLREDVGFPVRLSMREAPRQVTVATGTFEHSPLPDSQSDIEVYASDRASNRLRMQTSFATHADLVDNLSDDLNLHIIDEMAERMPRGLSMTIFQDVTPANADQVLQNVSAQTGYRFTTETRQVPVLFVTQESNAPADQTMSGESMTMVLTPGQSRDFQHLRVTLQTVEEDMALIIAEQAEPDSIPSRINLAVALNQPAGFNVFGWPPSGNERQARLGSYSLELMEIRDDRSVAVLVTHNPPEE